MKIDIKKEKEIVIIRLSGCLDYESVDPLHKACLQHLPKKKVIFNLEKLNFVGSIGITPFMDMMEVLLKLNSKGIKMCCVGSEFQRIFSSSPLKDVEIHENEDKAKLSFLKTETEEETTENSEKDLEKDLLIQPKIKSEIVDH